MERIYQNCVNGSGRMKVLAINAGSSTIKYGVFDPIKSEQPLIKGSIERIGEQQSPYPDYQNAMHAVFDEVNQQHYKIEAVGHRVVHGGEKLTKPTLITPEVIEQIQEVGRFVPLHYKPNLMGVQVAQEMLPSVPQVAIFDTATYTTLGYKAFLYGIPLEFYEKHKIRKYGFHGINHSYVAHEAAKFLGSEKNKIITCHLGNGCSITAFEGGNSQDTSMGLTPLEGVMMGSRCGDIDPSVILYLIDVLGFRTEEITDLLNKKSGLLGLCGHQDMRDVMGLAKRGDKWAKIAVETFVYRIQKYIGAYIATLNGVDAFVFTGGIGENSPCIREKIVANFGYLGVVIESEKNQRQTTIFSRDDSKVTLLKIAANEELIIAQHTAQLLITHLTQKSLNGEKK
jgi:acetate kinase